jgi:hypothetical protein
MKTRPPLRLDVKICGQIVHVFFAISSSAITFAALSNNGEDSNVSNYASRPGGLHNKEKLHGMHHSLF